MISRKNLDVFLKINESHFLLQVCYDQNFQSQKDEPSDWFIDRSIGFDPKKTSKWLPDEGEKGDDLMNDGPLTKVRNHAHFLKKV